MRSHLGALIACEQNVIADVRSAEFCVAQFVGLHFVRRAFTRKLDLPKQMKSSPGLRRGALPGPAKPPAPPDVGSTVSLLALVWIQITHVTWSQTHALLDVESQETEDCQQPTVCVTPGSLSAALDFCAGGTQRTHLVHS